MNFQKVAEGIDVQPLLKRIEPGMWEELTFRQNFPGSAHRHTQSIYLRWSKGFTREDIQYSLDAVDYPAIERLQPEVGTVFEALCDAVKPSEIGRAMLVKLDGRVEPHVDEGSYADYYDRFHVCLTPGVMHVEDEIAEMKPGEAWWFNHKKEHWFEGENRVDLIADLVTDFKRQRGVCYQQERLWSMWAEILPLCQKHYEEVALYQDVPLSVDFDRYRERENAGVVRTFTVRDGGVLVGYAVFFLGTHLHYAVQCAHQDVIFILPKYRKSGVGKRLIEFCDERLKSEVQWVLHHVKAKPELDFGPLLEKMGYDFMDKIFVRRL